jgi:hypothetical protein
MGICHLRIARNDRFVAATRWCAIAVAVLQLLLAGLATWILVDLHIFGTAIRPLAFAFAAFCFAAQIAVLVLAWTLPRHLRRNLQLLALVFAVGLGVWGAVSLTVPRITPWVVEPGARLPPNEIFGSEWPVAVAWMAFGLAQLLGTLPLCLVVLRLVGSSAEETRRQR